MEPSVWLIAGPTASGKSALALRLAEAIGAEAIGSEAGGAEAGRAEIVNADSMQLYADLRVLSARPSPEDEARVAHHLYGIADAGEAWSVGRWLSAAGPVLAAIAARGRTAIVVGGTGLYFRALVEGLADIPPVPAAVRDEIGSAFDRDGEAAIRERLAERDPEAAARILPGDRQRLIRALGVAEATGRALSDWQAATRPTLASHAYRAAVLDPPRAALYAHCDARMAAMARSGGVEEAQALLARRLSPDLPAMKAIGVREFGEHLAGRTTLDEAVAAAQLATRRYAKRQATWFRNQTPDWPRVAAADPAAQSAELQAIAAAPRA